MDYNINVWKNSQILRHQFAQVVVQIDVSIFDCFFKHMGIWVIWHDWGIYHNPIDPPTYYRRHSRLPNKRCIRQNRQSSQRQMAHLLNLCMHLRCSHLCNGLFSVIHSTRTYYFHSSMERTIPQFRQSSKPKKQTELELKSSSSRNRVIRYHPQTPSARTNQKAKQ